MLCWNLLHLPGSRDLVPVVSDLGDELVVCFDVVCEVLVLHDVLNLLATHEHPPIVHLWADPPRCRCMCVSLDLLLEQ